MVILGINAYHGDSAAALVRDGELVAAVEEERFNRVKHWAGFPASSIRYCLEAGKIGAEELDHVAVSFNPRANLLQKGLFVLKQRPSVRSLWDRLKRQGKVAGTKERLAHACGVAQGDLRAQFHNVEHHDAHIASGFHLSPYDDAAILSIDGMGDFSSMVAAHGQGTNVSYFDRVYFPHSVGYLYNVVTMYLGFHQYGDEYKVMGLAPYGEPRYTDLIRRMIYPSGDTFALNLDYFIHHKEGVSMTWDGGPPVIAPYHSERLEEELGPPRAKNEELTEKHQDIAASLQVVTEEILFHVLNRLHEKARTKRLCLVGGVAMNSVANGKVTENTPFEEVYIPAGAADNGLSFGAAFHVWHRVMGKPRSFELKHAFWGPAFGDRKCKNAVEEKLGAWGVGRGAGSEELRAKEEKSGEPGAWSVGQRREEEQGAKSRELGAGSREQGEKEEYEGGDQRSEVRGPRSEGGGEEEVRGRWSVVRGPGSELRGQGESEGFQIFRFSDFQHLLHAVVDLLLEGKILGWFQGKMEFGARALGSRSLVADPRRTDIRDIVNTKIKFREKFRPFAPSVLRERTGEYFEIDAPSPFMEKVFRIKSEKQKEIPAVTHVDGTGRLQTVERETSPRYYDLIKRFEEKTGTPLILNTSLNENEPIVHTPEQALEVFLRTRMDGIVLGNYLVTR